MIKEAPNINHLWAALVVEELLRWGIDHFFIAPGSRSTPLVTAVGRHKHTKKIVHFDERGMAFAALGYARATGKPAVWITTSGTAVANGLPAVIEAYMDGVPLILLTADRPPELRQTGSNQTINQRGIFGAYLKWAFEGAAPSLEIAPSYVLTSVDQAVHRSLMGVKGPVHLNWMFREPLAPINTNTDFLAYLTEIDSWLNTKAPYTTYASTNLQVSNSETEEINTIVESSNRGVIVAGRLNRPEEAEAIANLAEHLGWPLYTDAASFLRFGGNRFLKTIPLTSFFFNSDCRERVDDAVDTVLQLGKQCTSKYLNNWIRDSDLKHYILVDLFSDRIDPAHKVTQRVEGSIPEFCNTLIGSDYSGRNIDKNWRQNWEVENLALLNGLSAYFSQNEELSEPAVARIISECIEKDHGLLLGNSMPVRDMNAFGLYDRNWVFSITNRGASGIDGIIGTASGFAIGHEKPVTVFLGDLSFLHDLNSLALGRHVNVPFVVVVINNDGGGIFSFLPVAEYEDVFEPLFGTPHGLTFHTAADLFDYSYYKPENCSEFKEVYSNAIRVNGLTIIEVQTQRIQNRKYHKDVDGFLASWRK